MWDVYTGNLDGPQVRPAQTDSSCGLSLHINHDLAIGDLAIGDLAIECFGVHALDSFDIHVHVATNFVMLMKGNQISRNESSNFDLTIPISLAILRRMIFALISHFSEYRNFVFLVLVEDR